MLCLLCFGQSVTFGNTDISSDVDGSGYSVFLQENDEYDETRRCKSPLECVKRVSFPSHPHFSTGFHLPSNFLPAPAPCLWACKELLSDSCGNCWNWMRFSMCVFTQGSAGRNALMIALVRRLRNRHLHASWFWPSLCSLKNLNQRAALRSRVSHTTRTEICSSPVSSAAFNAINSAFFPVLKWRPNVNAVVCT